MLIFDPPVIAHRGASAYAPENTIIAFTKAAQLGVKWVEFDVMQAACGEPIIFHDETLDRTSSGYGDVHHHSYAYLQTLDAGVWFDPKFSGERIPSFHQVMEFLQNTNLSANIEIKALAGQEEKLIKQVTKEILPYLKNSHQTFLFSSFSFDALKLLRQYMPDRLLGLLLHEWEPDWEKICLSLNCVSVHVNDDILTQSAAEKIKTLKKALLCYTVNDPTRALQLYSWGVDAVFSDVPDKILAVLS